MHIKSKLRTILADIIIKTSNNTHRDRIINKQTIKNITLNADDPIVKLQTDLQGGFIRILASNYDNANRIVARLQKHRDDLGVKSVHIANQALDHHFSRKGEPVFEQSVLIKLEPKSLLISATANLYSDYQTQLKEEVLEYKCDDKKSEHIVIDFSSPNIAKPFHFGHLKSTILGNYLANINKFLGYQVTKLNYVGDWGTQYGLLSLGLEEFGDEITDFSDGVSPLRKLLDIYVKANERGRADESFYEEAKRRFLHMDTELESKQLEKWRIIKNITLDELKQSYSRLGIKFDQFEFESDYAKEAAPLVQQILTRGFGFRLEDGVIVAQVEKKDKMINIPVLRSDGASLYISRDVAAAISRKERYNFTKMLYVVGADQERHFHCLGQIVEGLGHEWSEELIHVKMGKVLGMSSRSGNAVLLSDIIDESTREYIESTKNTPTTKVSDEGDLEEVGHNLALSALFVYDMRNARTRHYEFDWDQVMLRTSRSGINLQTTFARLSSLLRRAAESGLHPFGTADELDPSALCCEEATNLLSHLDGLDTYLHSSYWSMDPSPLVNHALNLCRAINRARQSENLWVLGEVNENWARTRLSLFASSRLQLELIIKMIGLKPLNRV